MEHNNIRGHCNSTRVLGKEKKKRGKKDGKRLEGVLRHGCCAAVVTFGLTCGEHLPRGVLEGNGHGGRSHAPCSSYGRLGAASPPPIALSRIWNTMDKQDLERRSSAPWWGPGSSSATDHPQHLRKPHSTPTATRVGLKVGGILIRFFGGGMTVFLGGGSGTRF